MIFLLIIAIALVVLWVIGKALSNPLGNDVVVIVAALFLVAWVVLKFVAHVG